MAPSSHIHAPLSSHSASGLSRGVAFIHPGNGGASSQNSAHAHAHSKKSSEGAYLLSSLGSPSAPSSATFQVTSHNNVVNKNAAPHAGSKKKVNWGSSAAVDSPTNHNLNLNLGTHASAPASPMPSSSSSLNRDILATLNSHGVPHFARRVVPGVHDEPEKSVVANPNMLTNGQLVAEIANRPEVITTRERLKVQGATPVHGRRKTFRVVHTKDDKPDDAAKQAWVLGTNMAKEPSLTSLNKYDELETSQQARKNWKWEAVRPSTAPEPNTRRPAGGANTWRPNYNDTLDAPTAGGGWSGRSTPRSDLGSPVPSTLSRASSRALSTTQSGGGRRSATPSVVIAKASPRRRVDDMLPEDAALALERAHSARVIESLAKRAREIDTAKQEMVVLRREANKSRELEAHRRVEQTYMAVEARALRNHIEGPSATWEFSFGGVHQAHQTTAPVLEAADEQQHLTRTKTIEKASETGAGADYVAALASEAAREAAQAATHVIFQMLRKMAKQAQESGGAPYFMSNVVNLLNNTFDTRDGDSPDPGAGPSSNNNFVAAATDAAERAAVQSMRLAVSRAYSDGDVHGRRDTRTDLETRVTSYYRDVREYEDLPAGALDSSLVVVDARSGLVSEYGHLTNAERADILGMGVAGVTDELREMLLRDMAPLHRAKVLSLLDTYAIHNIAKRVDGGLMYNWLSGASSGAKSAFFAVASHDHRMRYLAAEGGHDPSSAAAIMELEEEERAALLERFPAFAAVARLPLFDLRFGLQKQLISGASKQSSTVDAMLALVPDEYKDNLGTVDWVERVMKNLAPDAVARLFDHMTNPIHVGFLLRCMGIDNAIKVIRHMKPRRAGRALLCAMTPNVNHSDFLAGYSGKESGSSARRSMMDIARTTLLVTNMSSFTTTLLSRLDKDPLVPALLHSVDPAASASIVSQMKEEDALKALEGLSSLHIASDSLDRAWHEVEGKMQCITIIANLPQELRAAMLNSVSPERLGACFEAAVLRHGWSFASENEVIGHIGLTQLATEVIEKRMLPAQAAATLEHSNTRTAAEILRRTGQQYAAEVMTEFSSMTLPAKVFKKWIAEDSMDLTHIAIMILRCLDPAVAAQILAVTPPIVAGRLLCGLCWLESPEPISAGRIVVEMSVPVSGGAIMALSRPSNQAQVLLCVDKDQASRILMHLDPDACFRLINYIPNDRLSILDVVHDPIRLGIMFRHAGAASITRCLSLMDDKKTAGAAMEAMATYGVKMPLPDDPDSEFSEEKMPYTLSMMVDVVSRISSVHAARVVENVASDATRALVLRLCGSQCAAGILAQMITEAEQGVKAMKRMPEAYSHEVLELLPKGTPVRAQFKKFLRVRFETQEQVNVLWKELQLITREVDEFRSGLPLPEATTYYATTISARRVLRKSMRHYMDYTNSAANTIVSGELSVRGVGMLLALLAMCDEPTALLRVRRELAIRSSDETERHAVIVGDEYYVDVDARHHVAYLLMVRGSAVQSEGKSLQGKVSVKGLQDFVKAVLLGGGDKYLDDIQAGLTDLVDYISGELCDKYPTELQESMGMYEKLKHYKAVSHYLCILNQPQGDEYEHEIMMNEPSLARAAYSMAGALGLAHCAACEGFHAMSVARHRGESIAEPAPKQRLISENDDPEALSDESLLIFDEAIKKQKSVPADFRVTS